MGVTKKQLADTLGVAKQTVVNYIDRLNLAPEHVSRVGKADFLDDYAASAIADAIGKSIPQKVVPAESQSVDSDAVVAALTDRIRDLKEQNDRLNKEIVDLRSAYERDLENLRAQLSEANGHLVESSARAADLADRLASIAERQQVIAATPWWRRGRMAMKLLGPGTAE